MTANIRFKLIGVATTMTVLALPVSEALAAYRPG